MTFNSIEELVRAAKAQNTSIGHIVLTSQAQELEESEETLMARMGERLDVMLRSAEKGMEPALRSTSGLTGGDAHKLFERENSIMGHFMARATARAIAIAEYNAAMGKIVAAPTAGSCGIMPGCLIALMEDKGISRENIILSMFTAAGFGMVIACKACVAGAQGGCQAECGSAAAMTAAAMAEAVGGSPEAAAHACAIALKNQLGLVCDPVAGLVEIPCIKRNAAGVVIAASAADMALAGIASKIPADEVISAMKEVGDSMSASLRETAQGGLAVTPTGIKLKEQVFGKD